MKYYYRHFIRYYDFAITYRRNFDLDYTYFKLFVEGGLVNSIYRSSEVGYLDYYSTGGTGSAIQSRWNKVGTLSNVSKIRSGLLAGGGIDLRIFNHFGTSITTLYDQGLTKVLDYKGQAVFINNIHLKWTVFLFF